MPHEHFASVAFIDDVPVMWRPPKSKVIDQVDDAPWEHTLAEQLGDRWRVGEWEGEYPLTGHLLIVSLALHDEYVRPLVKELGLG